eukprot:SAG31_NODE_17_length_35773_cov_25.999271_3_plen_62_part_00
MIGDERSQTLFYVVACDDVSASDSRSPDLQVLNSTDGGQVRSYFLVFVPTIREIRDFYREM